MGRVTVRGFAYGKVLLFGEHAVVYGVPALALGIARGMEVFASAGEARLRIPAWDLDVAPNEGRVGDSFAALRASLAAAHPDADFGATLVAEPSIPAGAGLGSSAALAVASARALASHAGITLGDGALFDAAMASERVFHGDPSGLDHSVAMHGGALRYVRGEAPVRIEGPAGATLVIAQVAPGADTGKMVAGVRARRDAFPRVIEPVIQAIGALTLEGSAAFEAGDIARLGTLLDVNHGLLVGLGVSTPELDVACARAREAGALGAKLTGAGGGGCIVALARDAEAESVRAALSTNAHTTLLAPIAP